MVATLTSTDRCPLCGAVLGDRPVLSDAKIEAAKKEFWRVLSIKELTLDDAWRAAIAVTR